MGKGPAPVVLGSATDAAAPGSYVLLAKTGITNVTGSSITGVSGVRPASMAVSSSLRTTSRASRL